MADGDLHSRLVDEVAKLQVGYDRHAQGLNLALLRCEHEAGRVGGQQPNM